MTSRPNSEHLSGFIFINLATSLLLSGSMMLTYIGWKEASDILERAIMESYKDRKVTQDVARLMNIKPLKCSEFGLEVMKRMTRPQE